MSLSKLPIELWRDVFEIALGDDPILKPALIDPLQICSWFETIFGDFRLRRPHESLQLKQKQNYAIKKVCVVFPIILSST